MKKIIIIIIFISAISIIYITKDFKKNTKKYFFSSKIISICLLFLFLATIYFYKSNFWIGNNIFEKIAISKNIYQYNIYASKKVKKIIVDLKIEIQKRPDNINLYKQLGSLQYMLNDFEGAKIIYEKARILFGDDLEVLIGLTKVNIAIENNNLSKETLAIINKLLLKDPKNKMALYILASNAIKKKEYKKAKKHLLKLLKVLEKNSLEYKNIEEEINKINLNVKS